MDIKLEDNIGKMLTTDAEYSMDEDMKKSVLDAIKSTGQFTGFEMHLMELRFRSGNRNIFSQLKTAKSEDIYETAIQLIKQNGETTELEVRDELRVKGYYAKYTKVMDKIERDTDTYYLQRKQKDGKNYWIMRDRAIFDASEFNKTY